MIEEDPIYIHFLTALRHEAKTNWHRRQGALAEEAGISGAFLSDILKRRRGTEPSFPNKKALAKACGFSYEAFLEHGQKLLEGKSTKKDTSLPKKKTKTESVSEIKSNSKGSDEMGDTRDALIVQILMEQISELKNEKEELKKREAELNQELKEQRKQINDLYIQNTELAKALGEANQALNAIKAQQGNGLESPRQSAANQ